MGFSGDGTDDKDGVAGGIGTVDCMIDGDTACREEACPLDSEMLMMDWYSITVVYSYWKEGRYNDAAVFESFFRRAPFGGGFAVFSGINDVLRFCKTFRFSTRHISFLRQRLPGAENSFFDYLKNLTGKELTIRAIREGTLVFPKVPLLQISGPLALCQLLEGVILNKLSFATLVSTNAARQRLAAGWKVKLFEFGMRRAQGPNGALSASRYSYIGTFDGTSNTAASYSYGIPLSGTMAHSFVSAFDSLEMLKGNVVDAVLGQDFVTLVLDCRMKVLELLGGYNLVKDGELAAFIAFARTYPSNFVALVDTYDTLLSGIPNFLAVAFALFERNATPKGIRLDSGDLAYFSREARRLFRRCETAFKYPFSSMAIFASNDLNVAAIASLNEEGHEINGFGIGTNLVTCQSQPSLGLVYKLVEVGRRPCMKLSDDVEKTTLPMAKCVYRLYSRTNVPAVDLIQGLNDPPPEAGEMIFCKHLYDDKKRCYFLPSYVEQLLATVFREGEIVEQHSLEEGRKRCIEQLLLFRPDHLRLQHPTAYKVSANEAYYNFFHRMWSDTAPIRTLE